MDSSLRILHVEDSAADAELVRTTLADAGVTCQITRVQTADEFRQAVAECRHDLILVDYTLPAYDGKSALRLARQVCPMVPILFVSGTMGEDAAIEALTAGATDYVLKNRLARLAPAVKRALREAENLWERKRAEEALAKSEEKYRDLVERARDIIYTLDAQGRITFASPAVEEILEYAPDELLGRSFLELVPEEMCDEALAQFDESLRTGHFSSELTLIDKQGRPHVVEYSTSTIEESGRVVGTRGIVRDITARKRSEEELARAKEAAEAANRAKSQFLANMSHEIRTPLAAIMGYVDSLCSADCSPAEQGEHLLVIKRHSENLLAIINGILDLSKIEAGEAKLELTECSVVQLVDHVRSLLQIEADKKGLNLNCRFRGPLPPAICTDTGRLRQILVNLVSNAIKFTERGSVTIDVACVRQDDGSVQLQFEVQDTGIGMSAGEMEQLFEPFTQADMTFTRRFGGTGLGLAISQRLAALLGGQIDVRSESGKGSTFTVTINAASLDEASSCTASQPAISAAIRSPCGSEHPGQLQGRVLLAEDDVDLQALLARNLRLLGLDVDTADNGRIAHQKALASREEGRPYHIILMDIQMPELDGREATHRLRKDGWEGPIVAITAHAMSGDCEKCLEAGCNDYLSKPVTPEELFTALTRHLVEDVAATGSSRRLDHPPKRPARSQDDLAGDRGDGDLVKTFLSGLSKRIDNIQSALAAGDLVTFGELAHQLKGTAGGFGFTSVALAAALLVEETRGGSNLHKLETILSGLEGTCAEAIAGHEEGRSGCSRHIGRN